MTQPPGHLSKLVGTNCLRAQADCVKVFRKYCTLLVLTEYSAAFAVQVTVLTVCIRIDSLITQERYVSFAKSLYSGT